MDAYIVATARTAGGRRGGRLAGWHPADLSGLVIDAVLERSGADPTMIDDVIWGCVGQVGEQASNIARSAVLSSSLPESVPGTTVDRQCGSSQQALHFAAQAVLSGAMDIVMAGGVESMTRVPLFTASSLPRKHDLGYYISPKMRARYPGVEDFSQFAGAEMVAGKYGIDKDALDSYAFDSHRKASQAAREGRFRDEIVRADVLDASGASTGVLHDTDEGVRTKATLEGIRAVKLLTEGGRLTAATSSQLCDGASAVLVCNEVGLRRLGIKPLARVHHMSVIGHDPVIMLEAPIPATLRALQRCGLRHEDIDLFEVNEAFASIPLAWLRAVGADPARLNVHGGAIALGHPLGASGTRLMSTLINALHQRGGRYGLQTMCEGGGLANVTIVERL